jgi:hypothetical protein
MVPTSDACDWSAIGLRGNWKAADSECQLLADIRLLAPGDTAGTMWCIQLRAMLSQYDLLSRREL